MYIFFDESFRKHRETGQPFGVLVGVGVPEAAVRSLQAGLYDVRRPYHGEVLKENDELRGKELLREATFRSIHHRGFSYHFNLTQEIVDFARSSGFRLFGIVCFDPSFKSFRSVDENSLDRTYRALFSRINCFAQTCRVDGLMKLIFDDRDVQTNRANARAITNYLVKSPVGQRYSSLLPYPLFAVSDGHNYGLQLADVLTTVVAKHFEGDSRVDRIWNSVEMMFHQFRDGKRRWRTLKVFSSPDA